MRNFIFPKYTSLHIINFLLLNSGWPHFLKNFSSGEYAQHAPKLTTSAIPADLERSAWELEARRPFFSPLPLLLPPPPLLLLPPPLFFLCLRPPWPPPPAFAADGLRKFAFVSLLRGSMAATGREMPLPPKSLCPPPPLLKLVWTTVTRDPEEGSVI